MLVDMCAYTVLSTCVYINSHVDKICCVYIADSCMCNKINIITLFEHNVAFTLPVTSNGFLSGPHRNFVTRLSFTLPNLAKVDSVMAACDFSSCVQFKCHVLPIDFNVDSPAGVILRHDGTEVSHI